MLRLPLMDILWGHSRVIFVTKMTIIFMLFSISLLVPIKYNGQDGVCLSFHTPEDNWWNIHETLWEYWYKIKFYWVHVSVCTQRSICHYLLCWWSQFCDEISIMNYGVSIRQIIHQVGGSKIHAYKMWVKTKFVSWLSPLRAGLYYQQWKHVDIWSVIAVRNFIIYKILSN